MTNFTGVLKFFFFSSLTNPIHNIVGVKQLQNLDFHDIYLIGNGRQLRSRDSHFIFLTESRSSSGGFLQICLNLDGEMIMYYIL